MKGCVRGFLFAALTLPASVFAQTSGSTGGNTAQAPTPTPAPGATGGTGGTAAPAAAEPEAPVAPRAPLFWRGTSFILDQSTSLETVAPGLVQSSQSLRSYQLWASIRPRFALGSMFTLSVRQDATFEMFPDYGETGSAGFFGDLWTDLIFKGVPAFAGIKPVFGLRAQWPVSLTTRARNVFVTTGLIASFNKSFELPRDQSISIGLTFVGSHPFAGSTTGGNRIIDPNRTGAEGAADRNGCQVVALDAGVDQNSRATTICGYGGAPANVAFGLTSVLSLGYTTPVPGLSFGVMGVLINSWLYNLPSAYVADRMGGVVEVTNSTTDQRMRQASWLSFSVDYDATSWLSLSAGYYSFRSVTNEDGQYGNPLYQPGGGTRLFFTMAVALDVLYLTVSGGTTRTGAAVSARSVTMNESTPRRRFSPTEPARQMRAQQMASGMF
ncbi:MAG: hypothetical protein Q8Q09_14540 [Deltaproteobacteria bacterium]|nr:hypothetical protein [Deltaproteobacteria bacterium]